MRASIKLVKSLLPPIFVDILKTLRRSGLRVEGRYATWAEAESHASGYDDRKITDRVVSATRMVRDGKAAYERDSVLFDAIEYSWPFLAALLQVALEQSSLRVVDFGGSLGSSWRQNKKFLTRLKIPVAWHVVEQPHLVEIGNAEFSDDILDFHLEIGEAAKFGVDVVVFASSLCYVERPYQYVAEAEKSGARFLIIDRVPTIPGDRDRISVQRVTKPIYDATYPIRIFGRDALISDLFKGWTLLESWDCDLQPDLNSRSRGYFFVRSVAETD